MTRLSRLPSAWTTTDCRAMSERGQTTLFEAGEVHGGEPRNRARLRRGDARARARPDVLVWAEEEAVDEEHDGGSRRAGGRRRSHGVTRRRRGAVPRWAGAGAVLMGLLDHWIRDTE